MATVKLGAIITAIAGSIGGWTFRRNGGTTMLYSKPSGASKNKLLLNNVFGALREVIQGWSLLTAQTRDDWVLAAPLFLFPDKFGDLRALNGRTLYIKLTSSLNITGDPSPDPTLLDSNIPSNPFVAALIQDGGDKTVTLTNTGGQTRYLIQVERLKNAAISPTFTRRKIIFAAVIGGGVTIDYTAEFNLAFPTLAETDLFNVYVTPQNVDGFRAVTEVKLVKVSI